MDHQTLLAERIGTFDGEIRMLVRTFDGRQFAHNADVATNPVSVIKLAYFWTRA